MSTTPTPTARPHRGRLRRLRTALVGAVAALVALVALVPTGAAPAGALTPSVGDILHAIGYDQPGPYGYHVVSWEAPEDTGGKPVTQWQLQRWNGDLTVHEATYTQGAAAGPERTITAMADDELHKYRVRAMNIDGWGPWGDFEPVRVHANVTHLHPYSQATEFVLRQAGDFQVGMTAGQLSYWNLNVRSRAEVTAFVDHLVARPENRNRMPVIRLYLAYFDRAPEPSGLQFWQDQLDAGKTLSNASSFFATSPEFKAKYGNTNDQQFVTLVYQNVLFRNPQPIEVSYWTGSLAQGHTTRGKLMIGFSESAEGKSLRKGDATMVDVWLATMGTTPTKGNMHAYGRHVTAGGTAGDLAAMFFRLNAY